MSIEVGDLSAGEERLNAIREKVAEWSRSLIDLGHQNTLLRFKNTKTTCLDLTAADPEVLDRLFAGNKTALRALVTAETDQQDARRRARSLIGRIRAFEEEQGVQAGKLAYGLVGAPAAKGAAASSPRLRAPLLLRPVSLHAKTASGSDYVLQANEDVEVNPVLLYALRKEYGVDTDVQALNDRLASISGIGETQQDRLNATFTELAAVVAEHGIELTLEPSVVVGLFSYEKLPMVDDLLAATDLLAGHDIVCSLAGDPAATARLGGTGAYEPTPTDEITPTDEYLVADADSSQQRAISTALADQHLLIEGPPGTGKSQTIANIIAGAAAQNKRVLFVAEKRAAIEAVVQRLDEVHLGGLVFDLHQQKLNKREIARQLADTLNRTRNEPPPKGVAAHETLAELRTRVRAYRNALHIPVDPWALSAYEVQNELLNLPAGAASSIKFNDTQLSALNAATAADITGELRKFINLGGARIMRRESPWWNADIRDEDDIRGVIAKLNEVTGKTLRRSQSEMQNLIGQTGLSCPSDVAGWANLLGFLGSVSRSVQEFGPDIFGTHLDELWLATADRAVRRKSAVRMPFFQRRKMLKQVREMSRRNLRGREQLHAELSKVVAQRDSWWQHSGGRTRPSEITNLEEISTHYEELRNQLAAVTMSASISPLEQLPAPDLSSTLDQLVSDKDIVNKMPKIIELREKFNRLGLADLLNEIKEKDISADLAPLVFRYSWLTSLFEEIRITIPQLRDFVAEEHDSVVADFQRADVAHRQLNPTRIRRQVAINVRKARDAHGQQSSLVENQAKKKSNHLPVRKLVEEAADVLLAMHPCWAMSPLVVSKTLPAQQLFDIVIFDEASQIRPHDAITSIIRGRTLVVAGDDNQLPPTNFFDKMTKGTESDQDESGLGTVGDLKDYESILTSLSGVLPNKHMLRWHYRSRDERLISFSNNEIYSGRMVTFPGAFKESPIELDVVDGTAVPGQDGSASEEVAQVVERVIEHARLRPTETLGVITMGQPHANRIEMKLRETLKNLPELDDFFSVDKPLAQRFFIKNLERVQGDERDVIILSIGYANRNAGGKIKRNFGPLTNDGGQRRLNVAVTRAKRRMLVISSFSPAELAPEEERTGPELLRRFLEFAKQQGDLSRVDRQLGDELNGFEQSVFDALKEARLNVYPQWGFSDGYRIDFALAHPHKPGKMVLAVETDGYQYHTSYSARDRDRLRQSHLENLGWRFHRLWSTAWFTEPHKEIEKILAAWRLAVSASEQDEEEPKETARLDQEAQFDQVPTPDEAEPVAPRRGPRPAVPAGRRITEYNHDELIAICMWLMSDGLQLARTDRIEQAAAELGFKRNGKVIVERLGLAVDIAQRRIDEGEQV